jgi:putative addiction module component (TIGR02574 family)
MSSDTSVSYESLVTHALALPPDKRAELAEKLWISVEGPLEDEELIAEIMRRDAEVESGAVQTIPFDVAMREIRDEIK